MPIINVSSFPLSAPKTLLKQGCGDLSVVARQAGLGKFDSANLFNSLVAFGIKQMLPGPLSRIVNNQTLLPQELPGLGALMGAAALLLDPKNAASNLQGLWGVVSKNAEGEFKTTAANLAVDLARFQKAIALMPKTAMDMDAINGLKQASASIKAGASPMQPAMRAQLGLACLAMGSGTQLIYDAYDASVLLRRVISDLENPLKASARVLGSASNVLTNVEFAALNGINKQLSDAGVQGLEFDLNQLSSLANMPASAFDQCGPDAMKTLAITRQACQAVSNFLSTAGFGSIDWQNMTTDLRDALLAGAIDSVAARAAGFAAVDATRIVSDIDGVVDRFLAQALCGGGSDNLSHGMADEFGDAVGKGLAAAATVSTVYSTAVVLTQSFQNSLAFMQQMGSTKAINSIIGGDIASLFGLASGAVSNPELAALRAMRECLIKNGADTQKIAIVDAKIHDKESAANTNWAMSLGLADAAGYFNQAQKVEKSKDQIKNNILNGTEIQLATTF